MGRPNSPGGVMEVENFLAHYGVKGMKWGVRKDRPYVPGSDDAERAKSLKTRATTEGTRALSNHELQDLVTRMNLEQQYSRLNPQTKSLGREFTELALRAGGPLVVGALSSHLGPVGPVAVAVTTALAKKK